MVASRSSSTRISIKSWENAGGEVTGWSIRDNQSGVIICKSHFADPAGTLEVMRRFFQNERVEALLVSEIDRQWPGTEDDEA